MKGQEAISVILISGVLIGVVSSVYFWGVPLIEKNMDISTVVNSKRFMEDLNEKIKYVANSGGKDTITITVPGTVTFDGTTIELSVETKGTLYDLGGWIPLGKNTCTLNDGSWGVDNPATICVRSSQIGERSYRNVHVLKFITLYDNEGLESYKIELSGSPAVGGENHNIIIENNGISQERVGGRDLIKTLVTFRID
ncbi:MAG: hypothetical protein V1900_02525 [Candidatus Aenigmatarchaeota archaeon]